jgi:hypothetical protein
MPAIAVAVASTQVRNRWLRRSGIMWLAPQVLTTDAVPVVTPAGRWVTVDVRPRSALITRRQNCITSPCASIKAAVGAAQPRSYRPADLSVALVGGDVVTASGRIEMATTGIRDCR